MAENSNLTPIWANLTVSDYQQIRLNEQKVQHKISSINFMSKHPNHGIVRTEPSFQSINNVSTTLYGVSYFNPYEKCSLHHFLTDAGETLKDRNVPLDSLKQIANKHNIQITTRQQPLNLKAFPLLKCKLLKDGTLLIPYYLIMPYTEKNIQNFGDFINEIKEKYFEILN